MTTKIGKNCIKGKNLKNKTGNKLFKNWLNGSKNNENQEEMGEKNDTKWKNK